jgi:carbonic anhydrase
VLDNGHTIQVNYDEGSTLVLDDGDFELSREQIEAFRSVMGVNNRPVQPLNDRRLTLETAAE